MNIKDSQDLTGLGGFVGEYAIYIAYNDKVGLYRGVINRQGEIVWGDILFCPTHIIPGTDICMSFVEGKKGVQYYDLAKRKYIKKPSQFEEPQKTRIQKLVEDTPSKEGINDDHSKFTYRPLSYLSENYLAFAEDFHRWGIRDIEGNILIPAQFERIWYGGCDTHFIVWTEKWKQCGIMDLNGNWIIPFGKYDGLYFRDSYLEAMQGTKMGILDLSGKVIIPCEYENLCPAYYEGFDLITAPKDGKIYFINAKQEIIDLI